MKDNPPTEGATEKYSAGDDWLTLARRSYEASTGWLDSNLRTQLEKNISLFHSKHPKGSKYHTEAYRHRSKGFRPKTRSFVRQGEAAAAAAFFSTADVAYAEAVNDNDENQLASAEIHTELLKYRLDHSIPWFLTCIGAYQDAQVTGVAIAHVHWEYEDEEEIEYVESIDALGNIRTDDDFNPVYEAITNTKIVKDKPAIDLVRIENFRIDPASDWRDPINSSPYVIEIIPMFVQDVIEQMEKTDSKTGQPKWKELTKQQLISSVNNGFDSIRQERQNDRQDPERDMSNREVDDFEVVYIHRNIIRKDGEDWVYYTAGTEYLLTDPKPIEEVYLHGIRPYVMGYTVLETHKTYPSAVVELGQDLQIEANELRNQRFDNVKLVLNKRYHVQRGKNVDLAALQRNTPGGGVMMDDVNAVVPIQTPDVTASSYEEQDRLNVDFDDLIGSFSQSTIQSNRAMNETVGGLQLASAGSNMMTEYAIRMFAETFVEPVMKQLVKLEQAYETDDVILGIAADKAKLFQKYGIDGVTDKLLQQSLTVRINVGVDATDPVRRLNKFFYGIDAIGRMRPELVARIKEKELVKEIFGKLGYKDGSRFFDGIDSEEDPRITQLTQTVQQLQSIIEGKKIEAQEKAKTDMALAQFNAQAESNREIMRIQGEIRKIQEQSRLEREKLMTGDSNKAELQRQAKIADYQREIDKIRENANIEIQKERVLLQEQYDADNRLKMAEREQFLFNENTMRESQRLNEVQVVELTTQLQNIGQALAQLTQSHIEQANQFPVIMNSIRQIAEYQQAPRSIMRDERGRPVGVNVEGFAQLNISRDDKGNIEGLE